MSNQDKKASLVIYVGDFIEKRDNQLRENDDLTNSFDKDSLEIEIDDEDCQRTTDSDLDEPSLTSDPVIETREGGEQTYKQQVYLHQYQPPTPEPVDIQLQEILLKPAIQPPPIHVHVKPNKNRDEQRTPSPIFIKNVPREPPVSSTNEPIFYNKYIPINSNPSPRQIIIHRYPELPPKPRPVVVDQWLPNKSLSKRIIYRHVNHDEFIQNESKRKCNRYIEYKKPNTIIELEIIRLPIIKLDPKEYHTKSNELTRLTYIRSLIKDPNILRWRI